MLNGQSDFLSVKPTSGVVTSYAKRRWRKVDNRISSIHPFNKSQRLRQKIYWVLSILNLSKGIWYVFKRLGSLWTPAIHKKIQEAKFFQGHIKNWNDELEEKCSCYTCIFVQMSSTHRLMAALQIWRDLNKVWD